MSIRKRAKKVKEKKVEERTSEKTTKKKVQQPSYPLPKIKKRKRPEPTCKNCGQQYQLDWNNCPYCGFKRKGGRR